MKRSILLAVVLIVNVSAIAQKEDLRQIVNLVFHADSVYKKIFFHDQGMGLKMFVLPKGTFAVIAMPNDKILKYYPNIASELSLAHGSFGHFLTVPFVSGTRDSIVIRSINAISSDPNTAHFVIFDEISIKKNTAVIVFHSSALNYRRSENMRYYNFNFKLKREKSVWIVDNFTINEIECCDKRFTNY